MKRFILAIVLVLAFCVDSWAINLRPYMQTPPEVQVFAKRVITDGGIVVDLEYCQKYTRLSKQLIIWDNMKFLGDANMGVQLDATGVSVQKLYDLSGNNNDATQATVGNQPVWTKNVQGGRAGMVFDGTKWMGHTYSAGAIPISMYGIASRSADNNYQIIVDYTSVGAILHGLGANTAGDTNWASFYEAWQSSSYSIKNTFRIITIIERSGTDIDLITNGNVETKSPPGYSTEGSNERRNIGSVDNGRIQNFYGSILTLGAIATTITTSQRTAIERHLNAYYAIY
uniref:Lectin/glucanase superfamily protein n=2 Tax=viral metagenome TaxID=1070528 RepID=A0A6M3JCQ0_9ZZZZ